MYIFFGDETNLNPSTENKFFIYGGIIVPIENLSNLNDAILEIRNKYNYKPNDSLKFDSNLKPKHITLEQCKKAKQEVVEACEKNNCTIITYLILHKIAKDQKKLLFWGIDNIIGTFNAFLKEQKSYGICLLDNPPLATGVNKYMSDKFQLGL